MKKSQVQKPHFRCGYVASLKVPFQPRAACDFSTNQLCHNSYCGIPEKHLTSLSYFICTSSGQQKEETWSLWLHVSELQHLYILLSDFG
jgi:hypothetical protein